MPRNFLPPSNESLKTIVHARSFVQNVIEKQGKQSIFQKLPQEVIDLIVEHILKGDKTDIIHFSQTSRGLREMSHEVARHQLRKEIRKIDLQSPSPLTAAQYHSLLPAYSFLHKTTPAANIEKSQKHEIIQSGKLITNGLKALQAGLASWKNKQLRRAEAFKFVPQLADFVSAAYTDPEAKYAILTPETDSLPEEFFYLNQLKTLRMCNTRLTKLSENLGKLQNLQILDAQKSLLEHIPVSLCKLVALTELNLSDTRVKKLPEQLGQLKSLTVLRAQRSKLEVLPTSFNGLKALLTLNLSYTRIPTLPQDIGNLKTLKHLQVEGLPLQNLPASLCELQMLRFLNIAKTKIEVLPKQFGQLRALEVLHASGSQLHQLPDSFAELINIVILNLAETPLKTYPEAINNIKYLQQLDLEGTKLTAISKNICKLRNLKRLKIGKTEIARLPVEFGELHDLEFLDIEDAKLKTWPTEINSLEKLVRLNLAKNFIENIDIGNFPRLAYLNLSATRVQEIPENISALVSLQALLINDTPITSIPTRMSMLPKLKLLDIRNTGVQALPVELATIKNLHIYIHNTPLATESSEALQQRFPKTKFFTRSSGPASDPDPWLTPSY